MMSRLKAGKAPKVILESTNIATLSIVKLEDLKKICNIDNKGIDYYALRSKNYCFFALIMKLKKMVKF